jgi:hypothetical protein
MGGHILWRTITMGAPQQVHSHGGRGCIVAAPGQVCRLHPRREQQKRFELATVMVYLRRNCGKRKQL